jgi:hypothetical protein
LGDFFLALARSVKLLQAAGFDNNGFMVSPSTVDPPSCFKEGTETTIPGANQRSAEKLEVLL